LYTLPVSAKRYALFNRDRHGRPVLRKASAHGLGHLRPPYSDKQAPRQIPTPVVAQKDLGVERWQHDVWYRIVQAVIDGHPEQVRLDDLPGFDAPAISRYAATTPDLLRWFASYNKAKPYREKVRPFGFLLAFQADPQSLPLDEITTFPRPVSPFDTDPVAASERCFDRMTGQPVPAASLKTYRQALAQYHLHPESKFTNADYIDRGETTRRHIHADAIEHIGKEANRWEEQLYLGLDPEAQIVYGLSPEGRKRMYGDVLRAGQQFGQRRLAKAADVSFSEVSAILQGKRKPRHETLATLWHAALSLEQEEREREAATRDVIETVRVCCREVGLREVARQTGIDAANLAKVLDRRRKPSQSMLDRLETAIKALGSDDR
jgi:DNA-binding phage protein